MIIQTIIDFFRDVVVNWIAGMNSTTAGINPEAAGSAIGGAAAGGGHFLALFIGPDVWGAIVTTWGIWLAVWITTALVAIIGRRASGS